MKKETRLFLHSYREGWKKSEGVGFSKSIS